MNGTRRDGAERIARELFDLTIIILLVTLYPTSHVTYPPTAFKFKAPHTARRTSTRDKAVFF